MVSLLDPLEALEKRRLESLRETIERRMGNRILEIGDMFMVACEPCGGGIAGFYIAKGMAEMSGEWMRVWRVQKTARGHYYYSASACNLDGGLVYSEGSFKNGWAWSHYHTWSHYHMGAIRRKDQGIICLSGLGADHLKKQCLTTKPVTTINKQSLPNV